MIHALRSYFSESKDGHLPDEAARTDITGLVNDPELIKDVCAIFHEEMNEDGTCFAVGKVYDVQGESYGCVSILSEDVAHIIGEALPETQESINHALIGSFLDFRRMCSGNDQIFDAWDSYLELILSRNFLPLYENGMRARLFHSGRISEVRLPTVVFAVYQRYTAL